MDDFEQSMWVQVRLWLDAAFESMQVRGECLPFSYTWVKVCKALGPGYLGRVLTLDEEAMVWNALLDAGYPETERVKRLVRCAAVV